MTNERNFSRSGTPLTQEQAVPFLKVMSTHFPDRTVLSMVDRGTWLRRIIQVFLDGDDIAYIKIDQSHSGDGWLTAVENECHERDVDRILRGHGLHVVPQVLVVDTSRELLPDPYVIQAHQGGKRLSVLLEDTSPSEARKIYKTLGRFYRQLHSITNDKAGVRIGSTPDKPLGGPTEYMYQAEIVEGSGAKALAEGIISQETYDRAVSSWRDNMDFLVDFQPTLVHYSPFPWNIYMDKTGTGWDVTKIMSLGDVMWWEPAYDLACLQYPPFADHNPQYWQSFCEGYGPLPARKRILLYTVLQTLCAMMGSYWELETEVSPNWTPSAVQRLSSVLDEIDGLSRIA